MESQFLVKAVVSFAIQTLIVVFLLEFCKCVGKLVLRDKLKKYPGIYISFGFSLLVIAELYIARFVPFPIKYVYWISVPVIIAIVASPYKYFRKKPKSIINIPSKRTSREDERPTSYLSQFRYLTFALPGLVSSSAYYLWVIISSPISKPYLTSFTLSNNDLGVYLIDSTNIVKSGYKNSGDILSLDPTYWIEKDHPAAKAFFAITPSLFNLKNWQFGNIGMIFLISLLSVGLMTFVVHVLKLPIKFSLLVTLIALTNPYIFYTIGNFFLAQTICLSLMVLGISTVTMDLRNRERAAILSSTFAALLVTSSETSIILLLFLVVLQVFKAALPKENQKRWKLSRSSFRTIFQDVHTTLDSSFLSFLIVVPWLIPAIQQVFTSAKDGVGGWQLFVWNPLSWIGVDDIGTENLGALIMFALIMTWIAFSIGREKSNSNLNIAFIILGVICLTFTVGIFKWGASAYQTWKLFTTLQPIL